MKQTLALKLGQSLTMTPQLQQAIRLLQLSALDLQQEIQETLEINPMLEMAEDYAESFADDFTQDEQNSDLSASSDVIAEVEDFGANREANENLVDETYAAGVDEDFGTPVNEELPVDSNWEDIYPTAPSLPATPNDFDPLANTTTPENLTDHLLWQLNLTPMAAADRDIALSIIDAIDANGMLMVDIEEIFDGLVRSAADPEDAVTMDEVLTVLSRIQQFDPIGVAARDLRECLLLQLNQLDPRTPWLAEARMLIRDQLDLLGNKDFATLKRRTRLSDDALAAAMRLIVSLNPRPGSVISDDTSDYIVPDVIVRKDEGRWLVELNQEATPQIRINPLYEGFAKTASNGQDKAFLRDNLQEARWFLKSLQTRHDTLLRVASRIVEVQRGFLEYGAEAMQPLILADVAEAVDLHESTISRVTNRKYLATPRGVFERKYFFSSHVASAGGGEVSSTAIRALIKKLTAEEDPKKPLSDSKIAGILKQQKITVARRTIAKYRESLSIPPSNERKRLV